MQDAPNKVLVSIIIPAFNALDPLRAALPAIRASTFKDYELIVVDDDSTDGTGAFAEQYADRVLCQKSRSGPAQARNRGAAASRGAILLFLDADVLIPPDALTLVVKVMAENPGVAAIFGSYDDHPPETNFCSQYKNLFHHFIHQNANPEASTFWTGCGAIRREALVEAGGFPESYALAAIEDVDMGYALRERGRRIRLVKELQVAHLKPWSLLSLVRTDILHRAIPWARLACARGLPRDLNFKLADRVGGVLSCALVLCLPLFWFWPYLLVLAAACSLSLLAINCRLYYFFRAKRGLSFALRAILFHWFYLFYSSCTFALVALAARLWPRCAAIPAIRSK
jgi:glycosyltransferase involved in cell wall biosynthesis